MIDLRTIYDNKQRIGNQDNFDKLITLLHEQNPDLTIINSYDRTLLVSYQNEQSILNFQSTFHNALNNWLESEITCPIQFAYNILPLNRYQSILRI